MQTLSAEQRDVLAATALESPVSAVSWPAIFVGAFAAAAASLVLLAVGSGLGLAAISPWSDQGVSATAFTVMSAVWLIVAQWFASGLGGYLTGRLRTKWARTHTHEVFFRDTAHGFAAWAVATIIGAAMLAAGASSLVGAGTRAAAEVTSGAARGAGSAVASVVTGYDVDSLFRSMRPGEVSSATRAEVGRILERSLTAGQLSSADRTYLADLIAARTGISQAEAQKRLEEATEAIKAADIKARAAADAARKAGALASLYMALSMLVGAFIAGVAAAVGGRRRDEHA
ncbi:MAG TPA: hypothetical protein VJQ47_03195 [Steroidobacteraceae bacterium]|nr:hypothetical protein [Steroidobacteraceae bacterium]